MGEFGTAVNEQVKTGNDWHILSYTYVNRITLGRGVLNYSIKAKIAFWKLDVTNKSV